MGFMAWIRKQLGLCPTHKWNTLKTVDVWKFWDECERTRCPTYQKLILRCEHCGNIKVRNIK